MKILYHLKNDYKLPILFYYYTTLEDIDVDIGEEEVVKHLCKYINCPNLVTGRGYCDKHSYQQEIDNKKKQEWLAGNSSKYKNDWNALYNSNRWKKERLQYLKEHPNCCICNGKATLVDHIIAHRGDEDLFYSKENWQPLCFDCHKKKTHSEMKMRVFKRKVINGSR